MPVSRLIFGIFKRLRCLVVCLPLIAAAACANKVATADSTSATGGRGGGGGVAIPVQLALAVVKPMPIVIGAVGTAEAVASVNIRSQVAGQLSEIHFQEGQDVRKGQLLFVLDPRPFQVAVAQAEGVLARDTAQATNAQAQGTRADALFSQGLISRDDHDTQAAAAAALEATLASDRAQVDAATLSLQHSRISSPMDGRTGALMVHPGDLISTADADPLITINQLSPIYITFSVPGRFLAEVQRFQSQGPLTVTARPQTAAAPAAQPPSTGAIPPGTTAKGNVAFIDNTVDATTGSIKLKAAFPNTDRRLWPGLFAQVSIQLSTEEGAIVVPAIAVQLSQQGQYVYVVKPDRTVEMRTVVVERQQGDDAIITSGLSAGEQVVTDGQLRLSPGVRVTPQATGKSS
jgi:membrane fusion protein, multidrug efflux system